MSAQPSIERVTGPAQLGEGPVWSDTEQALYWVDIDGRRVHRHEPATASNEWRAVDGRPGAVALTSTPRRLLLGIEHELVWLEWDSGATQPWLTLESPTLGNRCNDGVVDPAGRLVIGTMWPDTSAKRTTGSLYRVDHDGTTTTMQTDIGVPNGLAFDEELGLMYFADTSTRTVLVADYDLDTGVRHDLRLFLDYGDLPGKPDGACLDVDGCYWSASVRGGGLIRVTPDGLLDRRIELPVANPSKPAFGGDDLATLFVTSIGDDTGGDDPHFAPGDLLAIDPGVQGRPEFRFG